MTTPKISIITPSYNQGNFIEETIQSVLSQNIPNLEYIVVDGGSTDNTLKILRKYEKKLRWISEKDKGQTDAINKGIKMTTGDIIGYLNSDDIYLPDSLQTVLDFFRNNPQAAWVTGDYQIIDAEGKQIQQAIVVYKRLLRLFPTFSMLSCANFIAQPSTFWEKKVVKKIGLFNEKYHYAMDYEYWLRVMRQYKLQTINKPLSGFRIHKQSKGGLHYKKQLEEGLAIVSEYQVNKLLVLLHAFHNKGVIAIYDIIKSFKHI